MSTKENHFLQFGLCLNNGGYAASLEIRKVYRVVYDDEAAVHGYIRVIDESAEDHAYTANRFHLIQLPIAPDGFRYVLTALSKYFGNSTRKNHESSQKPQKI